MMTVQGMDSADTFTDYLLSRGLAEKTIKVYRRHLERAADAMGGFSAVTNATPTLVAQYANSLPLSASTRRQLRSTFGHWWRLNERADPPIGAVRVPPKRRGVCRALSPEDARLLVKAAMGQRPEGLAVLLGMYMALRVSEIATARWDAFDHTLEWYTVTGKGSVVADVPVHHQLREQLEPARNGYVWLFPGSRGRAHVTPTTVWGWARDVAERAGIGPLTTHQLRHTAIATVHDNTGDLRAASEFARHRRLESTRIYTRTTAATLTAAVESLDYV